MEISWGSKVPMFWNRAFTVFVYSKVLILEITVNIIEKFLHQNEITNVCFNFQILIQRWPPYSQPLAKIHQFDRFI